MRFRLGILAAVLAAMAASCNSTAAPTSKAASASTTTSPAAATTAPASTLAATTTTAVVPDAPAPEPVLLNGTVTTPTGAPLPRALVEVSSQTAMTRSDGTFSVEAVPGVVRISRPGWVGVTRTWPEAVLDVELVPRDVRALRVSRYVASDREAFTALIAMARETSVNALVFDTKDETGQVLYNTTVEEAYELGAVNPKYVPQTLLAEAKDAGLYTITRIVTFEDPIRANADREAKLAGAWIDMAHPANWEYPLGLGVEACELGFDEIQFDYVRWPAGRTATFIDPTTETQRVEAIVSFLTEARARINPLGCAVAADIFAIVLSSPDDQGIGQRPEDLSQVVDVVSPMIYPSHYSDGWLGFASPNDFPGPVVSDALDDGAPRMIGQAVLRPWLQAFWYTPDQILTEISETESRGFGWMLWNAGGEYALAALPAPGVDPADIAISRSNG